MNWSCSSQICSCLPLSYRLSILYCTHNWRSKVILWLGNLHRVRISNEYHQDAFLELAREIRETKFYRQVASRLSQREKVRLNTVQSPKLLGGQLHRDTRRRRETRVNSFYNQLFTPPSLPLPIALVPTRQHSPRATAVSGSSPS